MTATLACPGCRATVEFGFVERCGHYVLRECLACELVFSDPMKGGDAWWYDEHYFVRQTAIDDRITWPFAWALRNLPAGTPLLDVGCGAGTFVAYARRHGFPACGLDFSRTTIEAGRQRFGLTTIWATTVEAFRQEQPAARFGAITCFDVLEHVEAPTAFLAQVTQLLEPGGVIALSVPNAARWPIRDFVDYPPHHLTRWSERALQSFLEGSGLEILKLEQSPTILSINFFFGYWPRVLLYKVLRRHGRGFTTTDPLPDTTELRLARTWLRLVGSRARRTRDTVMWVPTLLAMPVFCRFFGGYNLLALARH